MRESCEAKESLVAELGAEGSLLHLVLEMSVSQSFGLLAGQLCSREIKWCGAGTALPPCLQEHRTLGRMSYRMVMSPGAHRQGWVVSQPEIMVSLRLFFLL